MLLPVREAGRIVAAELMPEAQGLEPPERPRSTPTLVVRGYHLGPPVA